jgi:hypothetical protein
MESDAFGLPPVPPEIFLRAADRFAAQAGASGALLQEIESIVARGAAQAARLLAEVT